MKILLSLRIFLLITILSSPFFLEVKTGFAESKNVLVTQEFSEVLHYSNLNFEGSISVIEALKQSVKSVETSFGGAFVVSIEDIPKDASRDSSWFYYVNGFLANKGAKDYLLKNDDEVWWDYHSWTEAVSVGATIGSFPRPFVGGYEAEVLETQIIFSTELEKEANALLAFLKANGVKKVFTTCLTEFKPARVRELSMPKTYKIVLAPWKKAKEIAEIKRRYDNFKKSGFLIRERYNALIPLSLRGQEITRCSKGGFILALSPMFNRNLYWLVSGLNLSDTVDMLNIILNDSKSLKAKAGLIKCDGLLMGVPIVGK